MKLNIFKKFFKRKHPYAPVGYIGRKTVEKSLGADIVKRKKLEKQITEEAESGESEK
ncbi:hypothetical protein ISG33_13950 [Glaciecola sp. MH2013]|uniref:hypothetical protein n=1 Tax=Glaciecola sp. MH2013 TaxID=2785524 RepID=UPI00189D8F99|nr:hypothetical protein [Glaciecola sp. MH2013]MBF7074505.1 hypothetical protein [Glaciecola sp. MH2013]